MALATVELFWLRMLLCELQVPLPTPPMLWYDNVGAIALASNPVFHARTKHIKVDFHFIREKVTNKDIKVRYIPILDFVFCETNSMFYRPLVCGRVLQTLKISSHIIFQPLPDA
jgi:hypothetical protein